MPAKKKTETALTLSQFIKFYDSTIEPRFRKLIGEELQEFRNEVNQRFDFLFKKFEDLHQEYLVITHQMKRFESNDEKLMKDVAELKSKVANLQEQVEVLEQKLLSQ